MKRTVSPQTCQTVLDLRRRDYLRQIAVRTGIPVAVSLASGSVKKLICQHSALSRLGSIHALFDKIAIAAILR